MKHPGWSRLAAQIAAYALALTLLPGPTTLADAASGSGSAPATSQFGPYFAELVNGGGSSLTLLNTGVVTECSGRLGSSNKPGLGCKNIGAIFVPPTSGPYVNEGFGNSAGHPQGWVFIHPTKGIVWGCSQTSDANGMPNGQCVQFNSIAADATPLGLSLEIPASGATLGSVQSVSWVTFTLPRSNGAVFECTAFLSKQTSGTPSGKCIQIGTITTPGPSAFVFIYSLGDVDFYYNSKGTQLGQCVRDYNPTTLAPVGACIK
jgi:hypothetical protein